MSLVVNWSNINKTDLITINLFLFLIYSPMTRVCVCVSFGGRGCDLKTSALPCGVKAFDHEWKANEVHHHYSDLML